MSILPKHVKVNLPGHRRSQVHDFVRKLNMMLGSGIQLTDCLRLIIKGLRERGQDTFRQVVLRLLHGIEGGQSFSGSMKKYPRWFSPMMIALVEVGEESGKLLHVLQEHQVYLDTQEKYRKKFQSALTYPVVVIVIAVTTVIFLVSVILPSFSSMYVDMGLELPHYTRIILEISNMMIPILMGTAVFTVLVVFLMRRLNRIDRIQNVMIKWILGLPGIGPAVKQMMTVYYFQVLITLLESGITLLRALEICKTISSKAYTKTLFTYIIRHFKEGQSFAGLVENTRLLAPEYNHLIAISEDTGDFPASFKQIRDATSTEIETRLETISSIIEPVVIVILGIVIGVILIGMYLPIFELSASSAI